MIEQATPDKAIAELQHHGGVVIESSLSDEDTQKLRDALRQSTATAAPSS